MSHVGKKHRAALTKLGNETTFQLQKGLTKVKELSYARFDESITINVKLGINPDKSDQSVRGSVVLPFSLKKEVKIIAFAKGEQAEIASKAGAFKVGAEDLVEEILGGWLDFDYAIATPDLMGLVGKTAKILGPKGLLPNKKNNTVALELAPIIKELKSGLIFFKSDKNGQINFKFGKVSFSIENLTQNLETFLKALRQAKPASSKGIFFKKLTVSSTMGPGIKLFVDAIYI